MVSFASHLLWRTTWPLQRPGIVKFNRGEKNVGFFIFSALSPNCYPFYVVIGTLFLCIKIELPRNEICFAQENQQKPCPAEPYTWLCPACIWGFPWTMTSIAFNTTQRSPKHTQVIPVASNSFRAPGEHHLHKTFTFAAFTNNFSQSHPSHSQLYNSSFQGSWVILRNLPCGCVWDREIIWLQSLSLAGVLKPIKAVSQGGRTRSLQNSLELRAVSMLHYWNLYYNKGQASF